MFLLKELLAKNLLEAHDTSKDKKKIKLPFILCQIDKDTEYEILVGDDRRSAVINSEIVPTFFNDNHVLAKIHNVEE